MTDPELEALLGTLGVDASTVHLVAVLPLLEVAWADGELQPAERDAIEAFVARSGEVDEASAALVGRWLDQRPSDADLALGRTLLGELAQRSGGVAAKVGPGTVDEVLGYCETVARAAGGLFGRAFTVSAEERWAIRRIAVLVGDNHG